MSSQRKYQIGLLVGILLLPALIFLEIRLIKNTGARIESAVSQTRNLVREKERRFSVMSMQMLKDTANYKTNWNELQAIGESENAGLFLFKSDTLLFWSRNNAQVKNALDSLKPGMNFLRTPSGAFLAYYRIHAPYRLLVLYLIKTEYPYNNNYLDKRFNEELQFLGHADLCLDQGGQSSSVFSLNGNYLFSLEFNQFARETPFWLMLLIGLATLWIAWCLHQLMRIWLNSHFFWSSLLFFVSTLSARWVFLVLKIPVFVYTNKLFSAEVYASSKINPSLGDLMSLVTIFLWYFWLIRDKGVYQPKNKRADWLYLGVISLLAITFSDAAFDAIRSLTRDSQISFDINDIYSLTRYTFLGLLLAVMLLLLAWQVTLRLYQVLDNSKVRKQEKLILVLLVFFFLHPFLVIKLYERVDYYPLAAAPMILVFLIYRAYFFPRANRLQQYLIMVVILSFFTSVFIHFSSSKQEREIRVQFVDSYIGKNEPNAEFAMKKFLERVKEDDSFIKAYFKNKTALKSDLVHRLKILSNLRDLDDYELRVYDYDIYGFNYRANNPFIFRQLYSAYTSQDKLKTVDNFRYMGNNSSIKGYLGFFPVYEKGLPLGRIFIHLEKNLTPHEYRFDDLFNPTTVNKVSKHWQQYSHAIYRDGQLIGQGGEFPYRSLFSFPEPEEKNYHYVEENGYDHLVMKVEDNLWLVVSKPTSPWYEPFGLLSLAFTFFTLLLVASILLFLLFNNSWVNRISFIRDSWFFKWLKENTRDMLFFDESDLSLLRTRIQLGIIFMVFITLALTAYFTINLIGSQNDARQSEKLLKKIRTVASAVEIEYQEGSFKADFPEDSEIRLRQLGDNFETEISLYNPKGELIASTIRELSDKRFILPMMDPAAYYQLGLQKNSLFLNKESIGGLDFNSFYVQVRNRNNALISFLQLPYFNQSQELKKEISFIVVGFINLYALLFIVIGILAWMYSRTISFPLLLIQQQMAQTVIGKKNEPIPWTRSDEIGQLVSQYNQMIDKLEESAQKLAQSEREGAWRDIARQIAHEIKNPLTPMKLSIQHLERAWKDQHPKLPETFKRVTQTLITQIDSLSELATGFSSFAKMPAPTYETIQLRDLLEQVVLLQQQYFEGEIRLEMDMEIEIEFDKGYLNRSLVNLIKNATQAIPEDRTGAIVVRCSQVGEQVQIEIEDNGTGISEEQAANIFTPYFSTKVIGMGLGLPIVKSMIESGGGTIAFTSILGVGTTFKLTLPVRQNQ